MKVCVISSIFPPYSRGGAESVAYAATRAFAGDHEVIVITCAPFEGWRSFAGRWENVRMQNPAPEQARYGAGAECRMRIFRFTPLNLFSIFSIARYPKLLRLFWHAIDMVNPHTYLVVRRILLKEKPDLILTHNLKGLGYSVHLAIHHSRFVHRHAKWIHTMHDMAALHPTGLKLLGQEESIMQVNPLVWLYRAVNRKLLGDPDVVVSPSQFLLDEYRRYDFFPKSQTAVVRNPVITEAAKVAKEPNEKVADVSKEPKATKKTSGSSVTFLYVGQLEPYKGIGLLLDVWQEFAGEHKNAELIIAGDGSMKEEVKEATARIARLQYLGFVQHDSLHEVFSRAHFTIIPSLAYENAPTAIGESFAHGIPVIASRIGGIPELVEDGVDGFLIPPGNREELMQAMEKSLGGDWKAYSKNALRSAETFSLTRYRAALLPLCGKHL